MSNTIDQKVVEMRFDNAQFEKNVNNSMSTIDKLKQALNFKGTSDGLSNLSANIKGFTMTAMSTAAEQVGMRFSALEVMGVTALANITNAAVNAGKNIISALTIEPVLSGFHEYETKMDSIQTIMTNTASKGTTMNDVIKVIDDLNLYADKTIYNFAEMTRNIGTFTAAGVGLEPAAAAIKGIANLAAASGSNSMQASTAMYQLSQALATGTVKLMDWNSVVNAGMGGELFQNALKDTARTHGVAVDAIIAKQGSFRDSLQEGWLTADILNETLNNFTKDGAANYAKSMVESGKWTQAQADALMNQAAMMEDAATKVKTYTQLWSTLKEAAQSGWGKTWEIIIGDFGEAKELFTSISDVIGGMINRSSDARNELLTLWKAFGGRDILFDGVRILFDDVMIVVNAFKEAMAEIFPPITYDKLVSFSASFKEFAYNLRLSDDNVAKLKDVFSGLLSIIDMAIKGISNFLGVVSPGASILGNFAQSALDWAAGVGRWLTELNKGYEGFKEVGTAAETMHESVNTSVKGVEQTLKDSGIEPLVSKIKEAFSSLSGAGEGGSPLGFDNIAKILGAGFVGGIGLGFVKLVMGLSKPMEILNSIGDSIAKSFKQLTGILKAFQMQIQAKALLSIAIAIGILAASLWLLSTIDTTQLLVSMGGIIALFAVLIGSMKVLSMLDLDFKGKLFKNIALMFALATAILILSFALKNIADLSWEQLAKGLIGITVLLGAMTGVLFILAKGKGKILEGTMTIAAFAAAVQVLVTAVEKLANLSWEQLAKGLLGVCVLLAAIVLVSEKVQTTDKLAAIGFGIILMAVGIKIIASAVEDLASLEWEQLLKGLIGFAAILAGLTLFISKLSGIMDNGKGGLTVNLIKIGAGLVLLAIALNLLTDAVRSLAGLSWEQLLTGLTGVGALLVGIALFAKANNKLEADLIRVGSGVLIMAVGIKILASAVRDLAGLNPEQLITGLIGVGALLGGLAAFASLPELNKDLLVVGAGLLLASIGIKILAGALVTLGSMSPEQLITGLAAIGGSLLILSVGLLAMSETIGGSIALGIAAFAIAILVPSLLLLSTVNLGQLGLSLLAVAGALAVFGVAASLLTPVIIPLLLLSGAFALIAVGALVLATAFYVAASSLTVLADGLTKLGSISPDTIGAAFETLKTTLDSFAQIIPSLVNVMTQGIIAMAQSVITTAPVIAAAILTVLGQVLAGFGTLLPQIATLFMQLLTVLCQVIVEGIPMIAQAFLTLIISLLETIATNIPLLIQAGVDIIVAFAMGVATAVPQLVDAGFQAIIAFINGLAEAIRSNTDPMIAAVNNLFDAVVEAGKAVLMNSIGGFLDAGSAIMNSGFISGITGAIGGVIGAIGNIISSAYNAAKNGISQFFQVGADMIQGMIDGILGAVGGLIDAAASAASSALTAAKNAVLSNSPSKRFMWLGEDCDDGMVIGFYNNAGLVANAAASVAKDSLSVMSNTISKIGTSILDGIDAQPTIRPVMDLTGIQNGVKEANSLWGNNSMNLATSARVTKTIQPSVLDVLDDVVSSTVNKVVASLSNSDDSKISIEVPVNLDGKQIAKVSAPHINNILGVKVGLAARGQA